MIKLAHFVLGAYGVNSFVLYDDVTREAYVIDPATGSEKMVAYLQQEALKPIGILLTHGHGDHIQGIPALLEAYDLPVLIHNQDEELLRDVSLNHSNQMPGPDVAMAPTRVLKHNDTLDFAGTKIEVIYTPGHTKGCVCYKIENLLFSGDTLFAGSIGRTDLYGGDFVTLKASLQTLMALSDDITVLPGHGSSTTIGRERASNPYCTF